MGTPVLTVPASPPPSPPPANHVCHRPPRRLSPPLHGRCPQPPPRHRAGFPAAVLLRHSWLCPLRGHGTFLSYDGFPPALRLLNTGCVECRHLAPEERLLFPPAAVVQHNVAADWTFL